jgi:hypothetical protein
MALQRMRWSNTGATRIGPRDDALLRSPVSDAAPPPRPARHVHIHLPAPPARTHDAAPPRRGDQDPPRRPGDQEAEAGELICRVAQDGKTGDWFAEDCDGNPLAVTSTANGLEIRHAGTADAHAGAPGELELTDPLAAADRRRAADARRLAARLAPGHGVNAPDQHTPSALRDLQGLLDRHYARRS